MADVLELVRENRIAELTKVLIGLSEKERKALSGPVRELNDRLGWSPDTAAVVLAVVGCVTGVNQVAEAVRFRVLTQQTADTAAQILEARQPTWLASFPDKVLSERNGRGGYNIVRALVRRGVIPRPSTAEYAMQMVNGLTRDWTDDSPSVLEALRSDPDLLEHEVWELFHTQEAGKALAWYDKWREEPQRYPHRDPMPGRPERTWRHALVTLSASGEISRDRLLDEVLGAFFRDLPASDLTWYVTLHDAVSPSLDEVAHRQSTYIRLLSCEPGPPVALGLKQLQTLHKASLLDVDTALPALATVLQRGDKGYPKTALVFLGRLHSSGDIGDAALVPVVELGLQHESADLREKAAALLAKTGTKVPAPTTTVLADVAPAATSYQPVPVLPVASPGELADLFAQLIEEAADPIGIERALDGALRFARQRPSHADALAQRARDLIASRYPGPWSGEEIRSDLCVLAIVWLTGAKPGKEYPGRVVRTTYDRSGGTVRTKQEHRADWTLRAVVTSRINAIARAVSTGGSHGLMSLPTASDGSLEAPALQERLSRISRGDRGLPMEAGVAALRLPPDSKVSVPTLHRTARSVADAHELVSKHDFVWQLTVGPSPGHYRNEALDPGIAWSDRHALRGQLDDVAKAVLDTSNPLELLALQAADGEYGNRFDQVTACWPLLLPHHPDLLAAHSHGRFNRALTKNRNGTEPLIEALGRSQRPLGPPAYSALVLAASAKNGGERTYATDAFIELASGSRLDGEVLGKALSDLLATGVVVGNRCVQTLAEAERADPRVAAPVARAIEVLLPSAPGRRDTHLFVDLLATAARRVGIQVRLPDELAALASGKATTSLAKACRRVPRSDGTPASFNPAHGRWPAWSAPHSRASSGCRRAV